ncbi:acyl-ACP desaturase [Mycolicibacterium sediminis]|uniref:Putative fatty acid desaturase n=1 Tax=Mycolicibacterium sediminis TaxID=1286180 RepID=A0A7I7QW04_9MYCO|nr:acyl-ACP desaturase [Mycolicibacterium sediminis]BBY30491.1 putative fatty acid desaturase [Mycolicibacterium sediminis]
MSRPMTDLELLRELEPVAEAGMNQHLATTRDWNPHDYVPWSQGTAVDRPWTPEQSAFSEIARIAMITNLLTEDNLPSYHRAIAEHFSLDDAWGAWVNRWTVEENRHGIALRDYLVVTRAVDPDALERGRLQQVTAGFSPGQQGQGSVAPESMLDALVYVTFQELATRVSHRNTGRACNESVADVLLKRVAADENLHMIFYRGLAAAALDLAPDRAMHSICRILVNFQMPGFSIPDFRRNAVKIAVGGIYDLRQHLDEVVLPVLRYWRIFERDDFTGAGERSRDELAEFIARMEDEAAKFELSKARYLERDAMRAERAAVKLGR